MNNEFSLSELYEVFLKTTSTIEIGDRIYAAGETLCVFDKIQIANFNEVKKYTTARGGFNNIPRVFWEATKEVDLTFSQGIFNQLQFALLCNAKMVYRKPGEVITISKREVLETDEEGLVALSQVPYGNVYVYEKQTGKYIKTTSSKDEILILDKPYFEIVVDYEYVYDDGAKNLILGQGLLNGFLKLEAKTRVKDDISGKTKTGIIKIPKLKLVSDLSMRLGENASPVVANFKAVALPTGTRENSQVMDILFLEDDIDSDM